MSPRFILPLAALLAIALSARADEITYVVSSAPITPGNSDTVDAPKFDASLGVLRGVRVFVQGRVTGWLGVENTCSGAILFDYTLGQFAGAGVPVLPPGGPT